MKCPKCEKEFEPCSMCRSGDDHQYCIDDKFCHECIMAEKFKCDPAPSFKRR